MRRIISIIVLAGLCYASFSAFGQAPALPATYVNNNEATDGTTVLPAYELVLGASSWLTGPPPTCSFSLPYAVTGAGKQAAITALEACRTATGKGSILDVYTGRTFEQDLDSGRTLSKRWEVEKFFGWYDLVVTIDSDPGFQQELAGHVETGEDSMTDPAIGAATGVA